VDLRLFYNEVVRAWNLAPHLKAIAHRGGLRRAQAKAGELRDIATSLSLNKLFGF